MAEANDDWLYSEEADNAEFSDVQAKINLMRDIIQPAEYRYNQWLVRDEMIVSANSYLDGLIEGVVNATKKKKWIS